LAYPAKAEAAFLVLAQVLRVPVLQALLLLLAQKAGAHRWPH
jgi:hypothetical protein